MKIPDRFRKMLIEERRILLEELGINKNFDGLAGQKKYLESIDSMIEYAAGAVPVPLGIVPEIIINGKSYCLPLATEEPSVIAAASYACVIINRCGGFRAEPAPSLVTGQIFLGGGSKKTLEKIKSLKPEIAEFAGKKLENMKKRGGGLYDIGFSFLPSVQVLKTEITVDVCDIMGANLINTICEEAAEFLSLKTGCPVIMAILTNSAEKRIARAEFSIPVNALKRGPYSGPEAAERIVKAFRIAEADPERAVTHNKGIMNGISALALACANDTRALESAVHFHASSGGTYRPLSRYQIIDGNLHGSVELPLPLALTGGTTGYHPAAEASIKLLGVESSRELTMAAASLGLAQNFAALFALVTEGIQKGHMQLHARKNDSGISNG